MICKPLKQLCGRRAARALAVLVCSTLWLASTALSGSAAIVPLSFAGTVDGDGYTVGGVPALVGSPFTLNVAIDDSAAATGRYPIESISYTLSVGTYTTVTDWTTELVATQNGLAIELVSDPLFDDPDEQFLLNLIGFGPSSIDDPRSWGGPALLTGDVIVRGLGGIASADQLSGGFPYGGTLVLTVIPEPASALLLIVAGMFAALRRLPGRRR
jgi:hypothetical protein